MAESALKEPVATNIEHTRGGVTFSPRVDILETEKALLVLADMPGVRPEDVDLRYERGELILHGRVRERSIAGTPMLQEYAVGDFHRVFQIHESIDAGRIEAACKDGVLSITLPKVAALQARQVQVRGE